MCHLRKKFGFTGRVNDFGFSDCFGGLNGSTPVRALPYCFSINTEIFFSVQDPPAHMVSLDLNFQMSVNKLRMNITDISNLNITDLVPVGIAWSLQWFN